MILNGKRITLNSIDYKDIVSYHAPDQEGLDNIARIRVSALFFIETIIDCTPKCADQSAAIRKVREAMMTANAAIVLKGAI